MSHRAFRYDVVKMTGPHKDHRGYLIADAVLARTGIQEYTMSDGKTRRELRPDDEVMHPDSLETLKGSVVVNNHPPVALDQNNTKQYAVGFLKGQPKEGEKVDGCKTIMDSVTVYDSQAIDDVLKGKNQMSQGYFCDVEMSPGVHPVYGPYDAIQRNIKHNHSAIVDQGRAGPKVGIKMDSANEEIETGIFVLKLDGQMEEEEENKAIAKLQEIQAKEKNEDEGGDGDDDEGGDDDYDADEEDLDIDAKWSTKKKNSLPKTSFAYVDPSGKGHLPYKNEKGDIDVPHLRNALARLAQTDIPASAKAKAKSKLEAAAKKSGVGEQKKDFANSNLKLNSQKEGEKIMIIFEIDGLKYQVDSKEDALFTKMSTKLKELETLKADHAQLLKNLDSQKSEIEKLQVMVSDEKAMEQRVEERIQVKGVFKHMFPEETKVDSLSTTDLQKKIVKKVHPEMDIEKKDASFVQGMALGIISSFKTDDSKKLEDEFNNLNREDGQAKFNMDKAQSKLHNFYHSAWKIKDHAKYDRGYVSGDQA